MEKLPSKWQKLQFGATILHKNIRELTLLDDLFNEKGIISFNAQTHMGEGRLFDEELKIVNIDKQAYKIRCSECYEVNLSNRNIIEISSEGAELFNLRVPLDVSQSFYRYADVIIDEKPIFQVEISRNHTISGFVRGILWLFTLGLIKQKVKPIILNNVLDSTINHKSLILGVIMAQIVYFPYDYDDWD
jgi:hypothetical protein